MESEKELARKKLGLSQGQSNRDSDNQDDYTGTLNNFNMDPYMDHSLHPYIDEGLDSWNQEIGNYNVDCYQNNNVSNNVSSSTLPTSSQNSIITPDPYSQEVRKDDRMNNCLQESNNPSLDSNDSSLDDCSQKSNASSQNPLISLDTHSGKVYNVPVPNYNPDSYNQDISNDQMDDGQKESYISSQDPIVSLDTHSGKVYNVPVPNDNPDSYNRESSDDQMDHGQKESSISNQDSIVSLHTLKGKVYNLQRKKEAPPGKTNFLGWDLWSGTLTNDPGPTGQDKRDHSVDPRQKKVPITNPDSYEREVSKDYCKMEVFRRYGRNSYKKEVPKSNPDCDILSEDSAVNPDSYRQEEDDGDNDEVLLSISAFDFLREATNNDRLTYLSAVDGLELEDVMAQLPPQQQSWTQLRNLILSAHLLGEQEVPRMRNHMSLSQEEIFWFRIWTSIHDQLYEANGCNEATYETAVQYGMKGPTREALLFLLELYPRLKGSWTSLKAVVWHWYKRWAEQDCSPEQVLDDHKKSYNQEASHGDPEVERDDTAAESSDNEDSEDPNAHTPGSNQDEAFHEQKTNDDYRDFWTDYSFNDEDSEDQDDYPDVSVHTRRRDQDGVPHEQEANEDNWNFFEDEGSEGQNGYPGQDAHQDAHFGMGNENPNNCDPDFWRDYSFDGGFNEDNDSEDDNSEDDDSEDDNARDDDSEDYNSKDSENQDNWENSDDDVHLDIGNGTRIQCEEPQDATIYLGSPKIEPVDEAAAENADLEDTRLIDNKGADLESTLRIMADLEFLQNATNNDPLTYLCAVTLLNVDQLVLKFTPQQKSWAYLKKQLLLKNGLQEQQVPGWNNPMPPITGEIKLVKQWIQDHDQLFKTTGNNQDTYNTAVLRNWCQEAVEYILDYFPVLEDSWTNLRLVVGHWYQLYQDTAFWKAHFLNKPKALTDEDKDAAIPGRLEAKQWIASLDFLLEATNDDRMVTYIALNEMHPESRAQMEQNHINSWTEIRTETSSYFQIEDTDVPKFSTQKLTSKDIRWIKQWIPQPDRHLANSRDKEKSFLLQLRQACQDPEHLRPQIRREKELYNSNFLLLDDLERICAAPYNVRQGIVHLLYTFPKLMHSWDMFANVITHWYQGCEINNQGDTNTFSSFQKLRRHMQNLREDPQPVKKQTVHPGHQSKPDSPTRINKGPKQPAIPRTNRSCKNWEGPPKFKPQMTKPAPTQQPQPGLQSHPLQTDRSQGARFEPQTTKPAPTQFGGHPQQPQPGLQKHGLPADLSRTGGHWQPTEPSAPTRIRGHVQPPQPGLQTHLLQTDRSQTKGHWKPHPGLPSTHHRKDAPYRTSAGHQLVPPGSEKAVHVRPAQKNQRAAPTGPDDHSARGGFRWITCPANGENQRHLRKMDHPFVHLHNHGWDERPQSRLLERTDHRGSTGQGRPHLHSPGRSQDEILSFPFF